MNSQNQTLESLTLEFSQIREKLKAHSELIKQALSTIQTSKEEITSLSSRMSTIQQLVKDLSTKDKKS